MTLTLFVDTEPSLAQDGQSEQITVKKSDLPADLAAKLQARADSSTLAQKMESYGKWVGIGHEVGTAVNESFQAVSNNAQELSKSNLGHFIMFMVGYSVVGKDMVKKLIGVLALITWVWIFVWYFRRNCLPLMEIKVERTGLFKSTKTVTIIDKRNDSENQGERVIATLIFIIMAVIIAGVMIV